MNQIQLIVIQGSNGHLTPMALMFKRASAMANAYEVKGGKVQAIYGKVFKNRDSFLKELYFQNDNIEPWQTKSPVKLVKIFFKSETI